MTTVEIEDEITRLEEDYTKALNQHADVHSLSAIWRRIKELKEELKERTEKA